MNRGVFAQWLLLMIIAAGAITTTAFAFWTATNDPHASMNLRQLSPQWWQRGECQSCHNTGGEAGSSAPRYHSTQFRQFTHGREPGSNPESCFQCHTVNACQTCHSSPPANHNLGFKRPGGGDTDARRHALLARLRPSACMVCHGNFNQLCVECHNRTEAEPWAKLASETLAPWPMLKRTPERP